VKNISLATVTLTIRLMSESCTSASYRF